MKNITKLFPGIVANNNIDFQLRKGEIHALLGENGAGKSTLMNVLFGLYEPDGGKIFVRGKEEKINNPQDAIRAPRCLPVSGWCTSTSNWYRFSRLWRILFWAWKPQKMAF